MNQISALLKSNQKFIHLCSGRSVPHHESQESICYYSNRNSFWLLVQPLKIEIFHPEEQLIMFHDILTESETKLLKELSAKKIGRSFIGKNKNFSKTLGRTCKSTALSVDDHEVVKRIA
ncbi:prolyl 4-hydroxylase subunit alpha-3-like [Brevipalpus obovatus]|uniref:prolyl 4-hydroxylase subunit alpha-3-like n=1 Tax=Brevipalpus obovatus TaxID=246614 RepID=UPI003D9DEAC4